MSKKEERKAEIKTLMQHVGVHRENAERSPNAHVVVQEYSKILLIGEEIHHKLCALAAEFPEEQRDADQTWKHIASVNRTIQYVLGRVNGQVPAIPPQLEHEVNEEVARLFKRALES